MKIQKNTIKTDKFNNFQIQTQKDSYPLTDLDIALPKLDKLEAIEAKKPPPPEAAACLGSFGAMTMKLDQKEGNPIDKREDFWRKKS